MSDQQQDPAAKPADRRTGAPVPGRATTATVAPRDLPVTARPERTIYEWTGSEPDCPADIVVNAGGKPLVIGAPHLQTTDSPRMDVGDRRRGPYYLTLTGLAVNPGLARLRDISIERARDLEKQRQIRTGEREPDWIVEARARADRGAQPPVFEDKRTALTALERATRAVPDPEVAGR